MTECTVASCKEEPTSGFWDNTKAGGRFCQTHWENWLKSELSLQYHQGRTAALTEFENSCGTTPA